MKLLIAAFCAVSLLCADNSIILHETTGSTQTSRPITISRVFTEGEIANYPRPSVGGNALAQWQANVMNRYSDGTVKHALITFNQTLGANTATTVLFVNDANPCHLGNQAACDAAAPDQTAILAFNSSAWGASIETTLSSATHVTNARTMVGAGHWRFWVKGPLMNQVIAEDRSSSFTYDYGYRESRFANATEWISSGQLTLPVLDASNFASVTMPTVISYQSEHMQICSVTGNTLNVCTGGRGYDGTTADNRAPWYGSVVTALSVTAGTWEAAVGISYKSLHPIFVVTQYTGWPGAKVEYILENDWVGRMQDQKYAVSLKSGAALGTTKYTKAEWTHPTNSRWRKVYWDGTEPGAVKIDFNLPYMIASKAIQNYDTSITLSADGLADELNYYAASDKCDIGGFGPYQNRFDAVGGRKELGPLPRWQVRWLYSMNPTLYQAVIDYAGCAPQVAWAHMREDNSYVSRFYDAAHTVPAIGHEVSLYTRPTLGTGNSALTGSDPYGSPVGLQPTALSTVTGGTVQADGSAPGWGPDAAHQSDFVFVPYLITGDWFFLEESYFWAGWSALYAGTSGQSVGYLPKSPTEPRGQARALQNIATAGYFAPTNDPAGAVYTSVVNANIAVREGQFNITDGSFYDPASTSLWYYGRNTIAGGKANPLYYFDVWSAGSGNILSPAGQFKPTLTCGGWSSWQMSLNLITLGRLAELGFSSSKLLNYAGKWLVGQIADPDAVPYHSAAYQYPTFAQDGSCTNPDTFTTWAAAEASWEAAYSDATQNGYWTAGNADQEHGYAYMARAAASYTKDITAGAATGTAAWGWILTQPTANNSLLDGNPKWAISPRASVGGGDPPPDPPPGLRHRRGGSVRGGTFR